jgi:Phosphate-selective porin O and P
MIVGIDNRKAEYTPWRFDMKRNTLTAAAALFIAAGAGLASAGSLELDRDYASALRADAGARSVLNQGNLSNIELSVGVRFGYSYNSTNGNPISDNDTTVGFQTNEALVAIEGDVTENMHARISFDFGPNDSSSTATEGVAVLEDAYVDWSVNDDLTLRVGQFVPRYSANRSVSEFKMMNTYRSVALESLGNMSWTQGIEAQFGGDNWDLWVGFNDGPGTGSTPFNASPSGTEADYSFNVRFDYYSDSNKARFDDQTSWRGSEAGWRIGAGIMYGSYGNTNPASVVFDSKNLFYTIDAAYEGDGWALRAAFYGSSFDPNISTLSNPDHSNYGFEVGGSVFVSEQWEGFARWDALFVEDGAAENQTNGEDTFNFIAIGANYYFVPESHAAKFTIEFGASLDETGDLTTGAAGGDTGVGVFGAGGSIGSSGYFQGLPGEDGQIMVSGTMQWLF